MQVFVALVCAIRRQWLPRSQERFIESLDEDFTVRSLNLNPDIGYRDEEAKVLTNLHNRSQALIYVNWIKREISISFNNERTGLRWLGNRFALAEFLSGNVPDKLITREEFFERFKQLSDKQLPQ